MACVLLRSGAPQARSAAHATRLAASAVAVDRNANPGQAAEVPPRTIQGYKLTG